MSILKHEKTETMIANIKSAQDEAGYTSEKVAELIGIPLTTYKNIIRSKGGNDFVKDSIINKLADLYNCSTDYILGLSTDRTRDKDNEVIIKPLDFDTKHKLMIELNNYLDSDYKTLCALHFLLCQNPSWRRDAYLNALHAFTDVLMESAFLELFQERSKGDYKFLVEDTIKFDDNYYDNLLKLRKANSFLETADFESSLKFYFEIVYNALTKSMILEPIANKAIQQILWLNENWDEFPAELKIVVDTLPQIQEHHFFINNLSNKKLLGPNKDSETYLGIKLSEQIISILKQYLSSTEKND